MANTILLKRSGTAGKVPVTANLSLGELSVNYTDGRLYTTTGSAIIDLSQNDKITLSGDATGTSTNPSAGANYSNLAVTLSSTGVTAGNYGSATSIPTIVVDAKGRVTSITSNAVSTTISLGAGSGSGSVAGGGTLTVSGGTGITTSVTGSTYTITNGGVTGLSSSGAGNVTVSASTGAVTLALPVTGPGAVSAGSSTAIPVITTDAYGRVASTTTAAVVAPAGTLTGSTLASGVTASSLTSVGTLTGLTVSGTTTLQGNVQVTGGGEFITNNLIVTGSLFVQGNSTTVNATSITTNDLYYVAAANAATSAAANGAGLITPYAALTYNSANTAWSSNVAVYATALYDNTNRVLTVASSHANSGGDVAVSGAYNALSLTLNTVNTNVGTFGSGTTNQVITVNGKGLITAVTTATITPAWTSITSTPTTLSGYGITDALSTSATIDGGSF